MKKGYTYHKLRDGNEYNVGLIHIKNKLFHSILLKKELISYNLNDFDLDVLLTKSPKIDGC